VARSILTLKAAYPLSESVAGILREFGTVGIWEIAPHEWRAYFTERPPGLQDALALCGIAPDISWATDDGFDWAARYQESLRPIALGRRFAVLPSPDQINPWPCRLSLKLFPGMAFGTGEHYTTASCLRLLETFDPFPATVLDVGCGTGILSAAAVMLGAVSVAACDVDDDACRVSAETAAMNGTPYRIIRGSASAVRGRFELVIANILAEILVEIMPDLAGRVAKGGGLICSGVLCEKRDQVLEAVRNPGFSVVEQRTDGDWWSLHLRRIT
jgi:ribosomal protein L11 methyltransferase